MDVLIKGLEMPSSCSECAFCGYYGNVEHMCDITAKDIEYADGLEKRRDDCPIAHETLQIKYLYSVRVDFAKYNHRLNEYIHETEYYMFDQGATAIAFRKMMEHHNDVVDVSVLCEGRIFSSVDEACKAFELDFNDQCV